MQRLSISKTAEKLGVSTDTIRRWAKKGFIKSTRGTNNERLFNVEEVKRAQSKTSGEPNTNHFEVLQTDEHNKYKVLELFAGAGGTALGFHNAGFEHEMLIEWDKDCVNTLRHNKPEWNVQQIDVRNFDFSGIQADVIEGGFPCQSFSYAGKRGGFGDTRGTLFFDFARAVNTIRPKIAVAENVRGLLTHDNGRTLSTMVKTLEEIGYNVKFQVLKAQYFDVPQKRERLIIVGTRSDLNINFEYPKEKDYLVTLRDALKNVPESEGQAYSEKKKQVMEMIPEGGYWRDLPEKIQKSYMGKSYFQTGGRTGMARRLSWDEPSLTLITSPSQKQTERCHPKETRPFTVREYARIQTFPDAWTFLGGTGSQYKQIGNAVPVNLGYHIALAVKKALDGAKQI